MLAHEKQQDSFALLFATQTALRVGIGATKVIQIIQEKHQKGAYEHDSDESYDIQEPSAKRARGRARGQRKIGKTSSRLQDRETASETIRG
ncbi:Hypothetical predicted protein [Paramuricea clavata]|uniref:Uncharacterized protein n=1 Tax=Paramuricea clavata TaxID=317549 RepID=A0A7D9HZW0_PARCT|nr:Hypothetical predicted protein [Paramuricea clavata]